jgi:hypothetical protein
MIKTWILIFSIILSFCFVDKQNKEEMLIIKCLPIENFSNSPIKVKISYHNNSKDTILLPVKYMKYNDVQTFKFYSQQNIFCSATYKMILPKSNGKSICNLQEMHKSGFEVLPPNGTLTLQYDLDELGCVGYNFLKGDTIPYQVELHIDNRYELWCSKVLGGKFTSNIGEIIIQ